MARTRNPLTSKTDARLKTLIMAGGTAEGIAKQLAAAGVKGVSRATVGRRIRELRGKARVGRTTATSKAHPRAKAAPEPATEPDVELPESPDDIPDGLSLDTLHSLLRKANTAAETALAAKELATFGAMGRLVTSLSEAIRKSTPAAKDDPSENPDMVAAAKRARETLHRLVNQTLGKTDG